MYRKTGKTDQNHRTLAKKHPNFRQGLQNLDLHECGFVCADIHVNTTVYQPALSVEPTLAKVGRVDIRQFKSGVTL